jgi:hypothetical protein
MADKLTAKYIIGILLMIAGIIFIAFFSIGKEDWVPYFIIGGLIVLAGFWAASGAEWEKRTK